MFGLSTVGEEFKHLDSFIAEPGCFKIVIQQHPAE